MTLALTNLGWELTSVAFSGGEYVAKGKNSQSGQEFDASGDSPEMAIAGLYRWAQRATETRQRMASWSGNWYHQLHPIAKAYADLPIYKKNALENWRAFAQENKVYAAAIATQIKIELSNHMQSYDSPKEMQFEVHHKQKLQVSTVETNHPVWTKEDVINFRVVHDVLGICGSGGGWSWPGANRAVMNQMPYHSPEAQEALFVEVVARTAYETVYRGLGGPKVGLMSEFLAPIQKAEGRHLSLL